MKKGPIFVGVGGVALVLIGVYVLYLVSTPTPGPEDVSASSSSAVTTVPVAKSAPESPRAEPPSAPQASVKPAASSVSNKSNCISNTSPVFTHHITDMSKVSYIAPPPTIASGNNLKTHSYIGTNGANVPVYAPVAMTLKDGAYYTKGPYLLDFQASCEVTVRFGHITNPVDAIKKLLPSEPGSDSRTQALAPVSFKAGELIGYTTGTSGSDAAGNWDFGVYNTSVLNRYADDPSWNNSPMYTTAVCPFDYFVSDLRSLYTTKFDLTSMAGNPPHGDSFCK